MRVMFDAAYPPAAPPPCEAVAFYIGGNTPHVWTDRELGAMPQRWRLPIFTRSDPGSADSHADASHAIAWLQAHNVPKGSAVAWDLETSIAPGYIHAVDALVSEAGYSLVIYGSLSSIMSNPRPSAGYWTAHWDEAGKLEPASAAATQYTSDGQLGKPWDLSVVSDSLVLWDTRSGPKPGPAPVPAFVHDLVYRGANNEHYDPAAATWQGRMRQRGWRVTVDGYYGPASRAVCVAFQSEKHLAVDGIVGPVTWAATWEAPVT